MVRAYGYIFVILIFFPDSPYFFTDTPCNNLYKTMKITAIILMIIKASVHEIQAIYVFWGILTL